MRLFKNRLKSPDAKSLLIALIIYFLIDIVIFWPVFFGKINLNAHFLVSFARIYNQNLPFKDIGIDQIRWFYPYTGFTQEQIKNFSIPFWNPYSFSGTTHFANLQTAVFYPFTLLALITTHCDFWNFMRFIPYPLAGIFIYLYLRNLKLKKLASFFGGLVFGFSPLLLAWGEEIVILPHSIMWVPLLLLFIDKFTKENKIKYAVFFALTLATSLFVGFIQSTIYIILVVTSYFFLKLERKNVKQITTFFLCFAIAFGIAAIQILPSVQIFGQSARNLYSPEDLIKFLNSPSSLVTYLAPDYFGSPATRNYVSPNNAGYYEGVYFFGVIPLVFSSIAIFYFWKEKLVRYFALCAFIAISLSLNFTISKLQLFLGIPFISSTIPNRILFIPTLAFSVISAIGFNHYLQSKKRFSGVFFVFFFAYLVLIIGPFVSLKFQFEFYNHAFDKALIAIRNILIPCVIFLVSAVLYRFSLFFQKKQFFAVIFIAITIVHTMFIANKYFSYSDKKFLYPELGVFSYVKENQGYYRTVIQAAENIFRNAIVEYRIFYPEGYDPANIKTYLEFTNLMKADKALKISRTAAELGISDPEEYLKNSNKRKLLNLTATKYIIAEKTQEQIFNEYGFRKVFTENNYAVYENPDVLNRIFLASKFEVVNPQQTTDEFGHTETARKITSRIKDEDFDYKKTVILEKDIPNFAPQEGEGNTKITEYKPNKVVIETESNMPKILYLADTYYPAWHAKIDGRPAEVLKANYTFRAVSLPAGKHVVTFYYQDKMFLMGLVISTISLLLSSIVVFKNTYLKLLYLTKSFVLTSIKTRATLPTNARKKNNRTHRSRRVKKSAPKTRKFS